MQTVFWTCLLLCVTTILLPPDWIIPADCASVGRPAAPVRSKRHFPLADPFAEIRLSRYEESWKLEVLEDGRVQTTTQDTDWSILALKSAGIGSVIIKGVKAERYICMNSKGKLYGSKTLVHGDCSFWMSTKLNVNQYRRLKDKVGQRNNTGKCQKKDCFLAIKRNGRIKQGHKSSSNDTDTYFVKFQVTSVYNNKEYASASAEVEEESDIGEGVEKGQSPDSSVTEIKQHTVTVPTTRGATKPPVKPTKNHHKQRKRQRNRQRNKQKRPKKARRRKKLKKTKRKNKSKQMRTERKQTRENRQKTGAKKS